MSPATRSRIPAHLREYVVDQDYDAYDEVDQAVWRFVLLQAYDRLCKTAHPAYVKGLAETGISVERIPSVAEMDRCLAEYGWGAVTVDGFIPPRAFQEFQAIGIMTIAAAIRRRRHLAYTPAPDIIHESAGHAPIVPDAKYRAFLRRFGEIGKRCFSLPEDRVVYEAIRHLSEVKEDRESTPQIIEDAQQRLDEVNGQVTRDSEAALLTRLHWWTVEYGLIGTPDDYKIYGAGLLSSLGESTALHGDHVNKIPLTVDCVQTSYDITRPQPQLFVCSDFDQLDAVLEQFAATLAQRVGGDKALQIMLDSGELGTIEFDSGVQVTGQLVEIIEGEQGPAWVRLEGPVTLSLNNQILPGQDTEQHSDGFSTALGLLDDGTNLGECDEDWLLSRANGQNRVQWHWASGVSFSGRVERVQTDESGSLRVITFTDARVNLGDRVLYDPDWGSFDLAVGAGVVSCCAGAADPDYYAPTDFAGHTIPHAKDPTTAREEGQVLHLYQAALQCVREGKDPRKMVEGFARIEDELQSHPDEWLLRWNLLESLRKADVGEELQAKLCAELLEIEKTDYESLPISTGLQFLEMI
ncbi:aromatic amino acid hydroxylase [bacterium]|nr:MAG: aromatic amino acid hydroxylase [bacterium]